MLKTIKTKKITKEIIEQIHSAIAQGSLIPGERLAAVKKIVWQGKNNHQPTERNL